MELADALGLGDAELVAFVGAGGKKTAMSHLVETARDRDLDVGYTTTTKVPPPSGLPLVVADADALGERLAAVSGPVAFAAERVDDPARADEKVRGHDPSVVDDLFTSERFDWLLVKADGARRREFKAPGENEPVVPTAATHVVPVASIRAVGQPLDVRVVHRPERVAAITDVGVGDEVTPSVVATVLASERGGLKDVPGDATVTPVINKADAPAQRDTARRVLSKVIESSDRVDRGIVTSFAEGHVEPVES